MTTALKPFQLQMRDALVNRFRHLKSQYDALAQRHDVTGLQKLRKLHGAVLLQAPTGVGKTLLAVSTVQDFSADEKLIWFWFVPFVGLVGQAQRTFQDEAPAVKLLSLDSDRFAESLRPGGVYALSWQSVASTQARRLLREDRDEGLSVDALIAQARALGYRIGCVVDEAHHSLQRGTESSTFFGQVLEPDYALLMTATPRDKDALEFSQRTGYRIGNPDEWATITRDQGVEAGLLKPEVKTVRFIARPSTEVRMLDFERVALAQATTMHRRIKAELQGLGVGLVPLLLVQVPNGGRSVDEAEDILVKELGFPAGAVRKHTVDEPDENLGAIANDPGTEVLIFKTAIAMGFDAPRAFTLAALRGVRDREFGIQVVGRIMRVHRLLQGRSDVPGLLASGYVFLANEADQEGLRDAADLLNELRAQAPQLGLQTVITLEVGTDSSDVLVVSSDSDLAKAPVPGDTPEAGPADRVPSPASLGDSAMSEALSGDSSAEVQGDASTPPVASEVLETARQLAAELQDEVQMHLLEDPAGQAPPAQPASPGRTLADVLAKTAGAAKRYVRRTIAPVSLKSEVMRTLPDDFERQVVTLVDFTPVLGDRDRTRARVTQRTEGLFDEDLPIDDTILAQLSAEVIAARAKQVALPFDDMDEREFLGLLEARFRDAMVRQGIEPPADGETLRRQLDLVLVRNPRLVRDAHRRVRAALIELMDVSLPDALIAPSTLARAGKNVYGVFPPGLNNDEHAFAEILDTDPDVVWWHRNPSKKPESIALWAWSGGLHGFYPDFIVAVEGRAHADGQALVEFKGPHLQEWEKAKAGAVATHHGRVFMVGKQDVDGVFHFLRLENDQLQLDGVFEVTRLRVNT